MIDTVSNTDRWWTTFVRNEHEDDAALTLLTALLVARGGAVITVREETWDWYDVQFSALWPPGEPRWKVRLMPNHDRTRDQSAPPIMAGPVTSDAAIVFLKSALKVFGAFMVEDKVLKECEAREMVVMAEQIVPGRHGVWRLALSTKAGLRRGVDPGAVSGAPERILRVGSVEELMGVRDLAEQTIAEVEAALAGLEEPDADALRAKLLKARETLLPSRMSGLELE